MKQSELVKEIHKLQDIGCNLNEIAELSGVSARKIKPLLKQVSNVVRNDELINSVRAHIEREKEKIRKYRKLLYRAEFGHNLD